MNKEYNASSISVLEGLEAVRVRPGMYIGSVSKRGLNHLIYEIVDNGVDEHLAGYCDLIKVTLQKDGSCKVEDNGRGIPVDLHEKGICAERLIFTTLHAGGKFDNSTYKTSGGLHGVGSSVVNALSRRMEVYIKRGGYEYFDAYEYGKPVVELKNGLLEKGAKSKKTGTTVIFYPDDTIFESVEFKAEWLQNRLHETAYLNPNLTIIFRDERESEVIEVTYHEDDGLKAFIKDINKDKDLISDIIYFDGESEDIQVEVAMTYTSSYDENIIGFCNNIATIEGGSHITGYKSRLTALINQYSRNNGILKDKDANYTGNDTRSGLSAIVAIKHQDPLFEGQTKTKLSSQDATKAVSNVVLEKLSLYLDINSDDLEAILTHISKAANIRKAQEKAKSNIISKERFSCQNNGKLSNCESRKPKECELFIVEGDSAGGSAKLARNRKFQAILPIRGKILNVEKASIEKVLANNEIKALISALGCGFLEGYGQDFDINKLKYNKIIIMTDADVDGSHIDTLLMTFFYRFMPDLITNGHIYIAMPPLYQATFNNGKKEYIFDDKALEKFRNKNINRKFKLQRFKGLGEMDAEELRETTLDVNSRMLKRITIENINEANNITEILMGSDVNRRKEFILTNGDKANVDV